MKVKVYSGEELITICDVMDAMDYIWDDELNTEEHPIRVIDENGREIEW